MKNVDLLVTKSNKYILYLGTGNLYWSSGPFNYMFNTEYSNTKVYFSGSYSYDKNTKVLYLYSYKETDIRGNMDYLRNKRKADLLKTFECSKVLFVQNGIYYSVYVQ